MAVFSIIKLSELEGARRIDAEYYKPEYLNLISKLKNQKSKPLNGFLKLLYRYPTFYNLEYYKEGVLVLKGEDITKEGFIQNQSQDFISIEDAKRFSKTILKEGDLIFSVRGYVGKVGVVDKKYEGSIISANLIRAVVKNVSLYFLWVYLNSNYGIKQIDRVKMITAQETIIAGDVKNLLVPIIDKKVEIEIEKLAKKAIGEIRKSEIIYCQAENLLLEELGLKDYKPQYKKTYTATLSNAFSAQRIDAEYFQPAYEEVIKHFENNFKTKNLGEISIFINHGKQPYYVENGEVPILIQKHLGSQLLSLFSEIINMPDTPKTDRRFIDQYPEYRLRAGDVLFYSVGAYLGRTNMVLENFEAVPASFITLIRTKQEICNPIYLALFLNSKIGQLQSEKWKSASAQQYIYPKEIKKFIIPLLPPETQQKIASLVQQSHEARKKAKALLEEAKRLVEEEIENQAVS
ncbi:MAG: restriction endonuclease subunit S [Caldiserica bacterium]|jgi:restriction endonuclease S subunit|nr:restriction endonuclease subunit S [Caldisericota bacterium]